MSHVLVFLWLAHGAIFVLSLVSKWRAKKCCHASYSSTAFSKDRPDFSAKSSCVTNVLSDPF